MPRERPKRLGIAAAINTSAAIAAEGFLGCFVYIAFATAHGGV